MCFTLSGHYDVMCCVVGLLSLSWVCCFRRQLSIQYVDRRLKVFYNSYTWEDCFTISDPHFFRVFVGISALSWNISSASHLWSWIRCVCVFAYCEALVFMRTFCFVCHSVLVSLRVTEHWTVIQLQSSPWWQTQYSPHAFSALWHPHKHHNQQSSNASIFRN